MGTDSIRKWRHRENILLRHTHLSSLLSSSLPQCLKCSRKLLLRKQDLWWQFHWWLLLISHLKLWVWLCQHSLFLRWKNTLRGSVKYIPFSSSSWDRFRTRLLWETSILCTLRCVPLYCHLICNAIHHQHEQMVYISGAPKSVKKKKGKE